MVKVGVFVGEEADVVGSGALKVDPSTETNSVRMVKMFEIQSSNEIGTVVLDVRLEISSFEFQIFKDNQSISKIYYDPYCKDVAVMEDMLG